MALKVRVLASSRPRDAGGPPSTTYRAEAYDDADPFRERSWTCDHEHPTVDEAFQCGMDHLATSGEGEEPSPA